MTCEGYGSYYWSERVVTDDDFPANVTVMIGCYLVTALDPALIGLVLKWKCSLLRIVYLSRGILGNYVLLF